MWEVLIISHILLKKGPNWYMDTGVRDLKVVFFKLILADLMTYVAKIYQIGLYKHSRVNTKVQQYDIKMFCFLHAIPRRMYVLKKGVSSLIDLNVKYFYTAMHGSPIWSYPRIN